MAWVTVLLACRAPNPAFIDEADAHSGGGALPGASPEDAGTSRTPERDAGNDPRGPNRDASSSTDLGTSPTADTRAPSSGSSDAPPAGGTPPPVDATIAVDRAPIVATCADQMTLRMLGGTTKPCPFGCSMTGGAHCLQIQPIGGGATPDDLETPGVQAVTIMSPTVLNSETGQIDGVRTAGAPEIRNGIGFKVVSGVAVFTFGGLTIARNQTLSLVGKHPVVLVSTGPVDVSGTIDARGPCTGSLAGPGGGAGGAVFAPGSGAGAGAGGLGKHDSASGGAGGSFGALGGTGGAGNNQAATMPGVTYALMLKLVGGSGGGGGGGNNGGLGGGGGGAVQIVASGTVQISGGINAGGCGGKGAPDDGGGGGGSGGAIVIEAPAIKILASAVLAVNGGGGGGSDSGGKDGLVGQLSALRAAGGTGSGADGGEGGARGALKGNPGGADKNGAGGGGGVGRMLLRTPTAMAAIDTNAVLSPTLTEPQTTTVQQLVELR